MPDDLHTEIWRTIPIWSAITQVCAALTWKQNKIYYYALKKHVLCCGVRYFSLDWKQKLQEQLFHHTLLHTHTLIHPTKERDELNRQILNTQYCIWSPFTRGRGDFLNSFLPLKLLKRQITTFKNQPNMYEFHASICPHH